MAPCALRARLRGGPPACDAAVRVVRMVRVVWRAHMRARRGGFGCGLGRAATRPASRGRQPTPRRVFPRRAQGEVPRARCSGRGVSTGRRDDRALAPLAQVLVAADTARVLLALRPARRGRAGSSLQHARGRRAVAGMPRTCTCMCTCVYVCVCVCVCMCVCMCVCVCIRPRALHVGLRASHRASHGAAAPVIGRGVLVGRRLSDVDTCARCAASSGAGDTCTGGALVCGGSCCLGHLGLPTRRRRRRRRRGRGCSPRCRFP